MAVATVRLALGLQDADRVSSQFTRNATPFKRLLFTSSHADYVGCRLHHVSYVKAQHVIDYCSMCIPHQGTLGIGKRQDQSYTSTSNILRNSHCVDCSRLQYRSNFFRWSSLVESDFDSLVNDYV
jgi:hypothetical protein